MLLIASSYATVGYRAVRYHIGLRIESVRFRYSILRMHEFDMTVLLVRIARGRRGMESEKRLILYIEVWVIDN